MNQKPDYGDAILAVVCGILFITLLYITVATATGY